MEPKTIALAKKYLGKQELIGQNEGPVIAIMKQFLNVEAKGVSWCGIFVSWILCRAHSLDKSGLRMALGFESPFYCDSTQDWLAQAKRSQRITTAPTAGDIFILLDGSCHPHHIGFVTVPPDADGRFQTIEGNTNAGGSVNGDGVYQRTRNSRSGVIFVSIPEELKK